MNTLQALSRSGITSLRAAMMVLSLTLGIVEPTWAIDQGEQAEQRDQKTSLIDRLLELNGVRYVNEEMANQYTENLRTRLLRSGVEVDDTFYRIVQSETSRVIYETYVSTDDFERIYHGLYGHAFSVEELSELVAFYQSPLGQKLVSTSGQIAQQGYIQSTEFANGLLPSIQAALEISLAGAGFDLKNIAQQAGSQTTSPVPTVDQVAGMVKDQCPSGDKRDSVENSINTAKPVYRGQPDYPYLARLLGLTGWVEVGFNVTKDGGTDDIHVTGSNPDVVFNESAIKSVQDYIYCPSRNGSENQKIRIRFEMSE